MNRDAPVAVLGAGWAGLSAALALAEAGVAVRLFEAAAQPGGRARGVSLHGQRLDNGQHVLIGAYTETLALLERLGTRHLLREQSRLRLHYRTLDGEGFELAAPALPAPLHLAFGIATSTLLPARDRWPALALARRLQQQDFGIDQDRPLLDFLQAERQTDLAIGRLWTPLCLAALNTAVDQASTRVFLRVLRDSFAGKAAHSRILVPQADLSRLFAAPASERIARAGGQLHYGERVHEIRLDQPPFEVRTVRGRYAASQIICALPHQAAARLLAGDARLQALVGRLRSLRDSPITTVYLDYPAATRLPQDFFAILDGVGQWAFDRGRLLGELGRIAVVLSADEAHLGWEQERLGQVLAAELHQCSNGLVPAQPSSIRMIREKRATFLATPAVEAARPATATAVPGFWLAGDYVATGLPGTLEGAVRSGRQAAAIARSRAAGA